jgi:hypothetical protein
MEGAPLSDIEKVRSSTQVWRRGDVHVVKLPLIVWFPGAWLRPAPGPHHLAVAYLANSSSSLQRIVVTEALRLSQVPLEKLLDLLREAQVVPQWEDMVLPPGKLLISRENLRNKVPQTGKFLRITHYNTQTSASFIIYQVSSDTELIWGYIGRTVTMCKNAFSILFRPSQPPPPFHPIPHLPGPITTNKRKSGAEIYDPRAYVEPPTKRRQSIIETKPGARELAPKPSNGSPSPMGSVPGKVAKKRGRPSKADVERNKAEAIAKGVIMAPTMTMATPSPQGAPDEVGSYSNLAPNLPTASKGTFYDPTLKGTFEVESPRPYPGDSPGKKKRKPPAKPKVRREFVVRALVVNQS